MNVTFNPCTGTPEKIPMHGYDLVLCLGKRVHCRRVAWASPKESLTDNDAR